jgi:acetyl esterase/lipase
MAVSKIAGMLTLCCASTAWAASNTITDVPYGPDERQRLDVYTPDNAQSAPVIFMVHGGAWMIGDKAAGRVVNNKTQHWLPKGYIVVSINYRMLPKATPIEQARDVASALALAQERAASWGGDRHRFILMGHSAGAHLIALLNASPSFTKDQGITPWLGTVLLDSAALDLVQIMQGRHLRLYDRAFGDHAADWLQASPYQAMTQATAPILAVCSSQRKDSCPQADRFVAKAVSLGSQASVLQLDLSHMDINNTLGQASAYTDAVDTFLQTLLKPSGLMRPPKSGG